MSPAELTQMVEQFRSSEESDAWGLADQLEDFVERYRGVLRRRF